MKYFRLFLIALVAMIFSALTAATPAYAQTSPPLPNGQSWGFYSGEDPGSGFADVLPGPDGNLTQDTPRWLVVVEGGDTVRAYCLEQNVEVAADPSVLWAATPHADTGLANLGRISWLVQNAPSIGTPVATGDATFDYAANSTAITLAARFLSEGRDYSIFPNASIVARADELVALSAGQSAPATPVFFNIALSSDTVGNDSVLTAVLTQDGGAPYAGQTITFDTYAGPQSAVTDASGVAIVNIPAPAEPTAVTATWAGTLDPGSVLVPENGGQRVMIEEPANITRVAAATVSPAGTEPQESTTTLPTDSPLAAPTGSDGTSGGGATTLPYTGIPAWVTIPFALLAAALAAFGIHLRHRAANSTS